MTSKLTREELLNIIETDHVQCGEASALACMALAAMDSEPVAWTWHYREQWHVTNDERRAEFVAKDGDVDVLPLYRHAQPVPVVEREPIAWLNDAYLARGVVDGEAGSEDAGPGYIPVYREAGPQQPVVRDIDELRLAFEAAERESDDGFNLHKYGIGYADDETQGRWEVWLACRAAMLQAQSDDDGEPTDDERIMAIEGIHNCERCGDEGWVVGEMGITRCACGQAGNSPQSTKCKTVDELLACVPLNTGRSRGHFISLCNEFWNWSEMDLVCADDRGYELRMEWDGKVFKHPVTQALWRMYLAAPGNSPVIPDGYVMVPKEPTDEMIAAAMNCDDVLFNSDESFCVQFGNIYEAMLEAAPTGIQMNSNTWIPVSERMPEDSGTYQVWNGKHVGAVPFLFGSFQCLNPEQVTHWMPTAKPPLEMKP